MASDDEVHGPCPISKEIESRVEREDVLRCREPEEKLFSVRRPGGK